MKVRLVSILLVCSFLCVVGAAPAFSATVAVGTCLPGKVSFDSISDAVQGVPTGSTILVCPGTYAEQIVIQKSVTLKGQTSGNTAYPVVVPPAGGLLMNATGLFVFSFFDGTPIAAQVVITGGVQVTIQDMAFDATGYNLPACNALVVGILAQDSSLELDRVAVKNQIETGPPPCAASGSGAGVLVQNDSVNPTTAKVTGSTFINASQAFESDGSANATTLTSNSFTGNPASNYNAISILSGNGTVKNNTITDYNWPPAGTNSGIAAFGVFMECVTTGTVQGNTISSTQVGVYIQDPGCPTSGISVLTNEITNALINGIFLGEVSGLVQGNSIDSSLTAIYLPAGSSVNTVNNNTINDACTAFASSSLATSNSILNSTISNAKNVSITNETGVCP
jgi:hypothetical protein